MAIAVAAGAKAQSVSVSDLEKMVLCTDFTGFQKIVTDLGITMDEKPYEHTSGKHQIIFNSRYAERNVKVYSVGISFLKEGSTRVFVKTKNKDYYLSLTNELLQWGAFSIKQPITQDTDGSLFTTYASQKFPQYELRTDAYNDTDDNATYFTIKLTKVN